MEKPFEEKEVEAKEWAPVCPYCQELSKLVGGEELYPHRPDLYSLVFYKCRPCEAYVGCHKGTVQPLGRLANAELRLLRSNAHALFDPLWKRGDMKRSEAYAWLANQLGIAGELCHIGMFDEEHCRRVVAVCSSSTKS